MWKQGCFSHVYRPIESLRPLQERQVRLYDSRFRAHHDNNVKSKFEAQSSLNKYHKKGQQEEIFFVC